MDKKSVIIFSRLCNVAQNLYYFCVEPEAQGKNRITGGEHWFHTPEQMAFLDGRIRRKKRHFEELDRKKVSK